MFKPSYTVVTCVLVFFAILAFVRHVFIGYIPRTSNIFVNSREHFLAIAGHQEIVWHSMDENAFLAAQADDKPILLVVGLSSTRLGHEFDSKAFEDPDTARFVSQNFYCVRVDGFEHPEWINALLPISRIRLGLLPSYQVWTLDPDGRVLSLIGRLYSNGDLDSRSVYKALVNSRDQYETFRNRGIQKGIAVDLQVTDLQQLEQSTDLGVPRLDAFTRSWESEMDPQCGGFPRGKVQVLFPNALKFLTMTGNQVLWNTAASPILQSKMVDVQDGGFFRMGFGRDVDEVELGKNVRQNAEMMVALALQGQTFDDTFSADISRFTFDWLIQVANRNGMLPACQDDDENPQGRSPRLSFPTWRLHDVLNDSDRDWASEKFGLDPMHNSQMIPYIASRSALLDSQSTYDRVIGLMRLGTTTKPEFNDSGYLDINGHAVARMLEAVRMWGDMKRLTALQALIKQLGEFKYQNDLLHRAGDEEHRLGYLGDYLAFSDARLQEYLVTGDTRAMEEGLHYLNLARGEFRGSRMGQLDLVRSGDEMGRFEALCVPEIADNSGESCSAQAIRLQLAYGRLLGDTEDGKAMLQSTNEMAGVFAKIADQGGAATAGYCCAAADLLDGRYAITVGPKAHDLANSLYRLRPTRFVAPAMGRVRRDLQHNAPGIYLIGKTIQGPLSVEDAADLLPVGFSSKPTP